MGIDTPFVPEWMLIENVFSAGETAGVNWVVAKWKWWYNGYCLLPVGHPWRDLDLQSSDYDKGPDVHGGVTYGPDVNGWIGFDFNHYMDWWPGELEFWTERGMPHLGERRDQIERTPEEVVQEAEQLATQIAAVLVR